MVSLFARASALRAPALIAFSLLLTGCTESPHQHPAPSPGFATLEPGEAAPQFTRLDVDGDSVHVGPGQPLTFVNLWATWCAPCIEEFPDIERMHTELGPDGLRVLAVNVEEVDTDALKAFAADLGVTFRLVIDPPAVLQDEFKAMAVPSSYLIDSEGVIRSAWTGRLPHDAFDVVASHMPTVD